MDTVVRTYDPKEVVITFGGIIFEGYGEGTVITITQNGDSFEKVRGADGGVDRINKNSNDYRISVQLKQTSPINDALSLISIADKASNNGKLPFTVKDLRGTSLFFAESAWIAKEPDPEFADTITNREWLFDTGVASQFIGGNLS